MRNPFRETRVGAGINSGPKLSRSQSCSRCIGRTVESIELEQRLHRVKRSSIKLDLFYDLDFLVIINEQA